MSHYKVILIVFRKMKGLITTDFFDRGTTANITFCRILGQNSRYLFNVPRITGEIIFGVLFTYVKRLFFSNQYKIGRS